MRIFDPLYGDFSLSESVRTLCQTPEVRRLSQIRLLNTLTPSLATLGELRRYSHTLGVLYLAQQNQHFRSTNECDAFVAAVLLHDIGTPPFGHLMEYHLKERFSWDHETVIMQVLDGTHVPENSAHQIFAKQTGQFVKALRKTNLDIAVIREIVAGSHRLSHLLFGTLDFDNLDNVARMNWALRPNIDPSGLVKLAKHLDVTEVGDVLLSPANDRYVEEWLELRSSAYDTIVFDMPTVAAQAVLSKCLEQALESNLLSEIDWSLTDEDLIDKLLKDRLTKNAIKNQFFGRLPEPLFCVQVKGTLKTIGLESRKHAIAALTRSLGSILGSGALPYIFVDRGTFSKVLSLTDPDTGDVRRIGETSESVVLYAFSTQARVPSHALCMTALESALHELGIRGDLIVRCQVGAKSNRSDHQQTLKIPS